MLDAILIQSQYACCDAQYACCTIFSAKWTLVLNPSDLEENYPYCIPRCILHIARCILHFAICILRFIHIPHEHSTLGLTLTLTSDLKKTHSTEPLVSDPRKNIQSRTPNFSSSSTFIFDGLRNTDIAFSILAT